MAERKKAAPKLLAGGNPQGDGWFLRRSGARVSPRAAAEMLHNAEC